MWNPIKSWTQKKEGEFWRLLMENTGPVLREIKKILEDILKELKDKWQILQTVRYMTIVNDFTNVIIVIKYLIKL